LADAAGNSTATANRLASTLPLFSWRKDLLMLHLHAVIADRSDLLLLPGKIVPISKATALTMVNRMTRLNREWPGQDRIKVQG
jgi:hypothetical protein